MTSRHSLVAHGVIACILLTSGAAGAEDGQAWPTPVPGFKAPLAGEHPRLLFRRTDLDALRRKAQTPVGKAMVARLKYLLGGGEAMPKEFNPNPPVAEGKLDLSGKWDGGSVVEFKQEGKSLTVLKSKGASWMTGTLSGFEASMIYGKNNTPLVGAIAPSGMQIHWDNGTTWTRIGYRAPKWTYTPGDKVKSIAVKTGKGDVTLVTLVAEGNHPEPKVDGDTITLGGQTITCDGKKIALGTFTPAK